MRDRLPPNDRPDIYLASRRQTDDARTAVVGSSDNLGMLEYSSLIALEA